MKITDIFIKRPVFSTVISLLIFLMGFIAYQHMAVRQFPLIQSSVVTVSTNYPGANAKLMEGFVTTPIENALSGVTGLDYMSSTSTQGSSVIKLHLKLGTNLNQALSDISDKVSSVRWQLPKAVKDPIIAREDPNAQPSMYIAFSSNHMTPEAITDYLLRVVQPQLGTLPGVAEAEILGRSEYAMRIWLNPQKMAAYNITAEDVQNALERNNVQSAAGRIDGKWQEFNVSARTDLRTPKQFNQLVLSKKDGQLVRLHNVGYAKLGTSSERASAYFNGKRAVVVALILKATANPLTVSKEVNKIYPRIKQYLPKQMHTKIIWDNAIFIKMSLHEVRETIIIAVICVILVIFIFIGSLRSVFIPVTTIPLSLFGICSVMMLLGYTINTITLLAWILAVGLVVDDAIVVVENIHRYIDQGLTPFEAAIKGAQQIRFAVIAMTVTLAAVYVPIGFLGGVVGTLFREFAFTLAGAVIVSGFIALTLSPMMCSKLMRSEETRLAQFVDKRFGRFANFYQRVLNTTLKWPWLIMLVAILVYLGLGYLYSRTPQELSPPEDQGFIISMINAPASSNLAYTEKYTSMIPSIYKTIPDTLGYGIVNGIPHGVDTALSFLVLQPPSKRKLPASAIIGELMKKFWGITGVQIFPFSPPSLPVAGGFEPISFVLTTTGSYQHLANQMKKLISSIRKNPRIVNVNTNLKIDKPGISINVNRNKAADLGISMSGIGDALNLLLGEPTITRFVKNGRSYEVIPKLQGRFIRDPHELDNIQLSTASGRLVPLSNLITLRNTIEPRSLNHFQQLRSAKLTGMMVPGYTLGQALNYLKNTANKNLSSDVQYNFAGLSRQFEKASGTFQTTLWFAVIFIFLVLAAQFESFIDPFIVMLSVPLSLGGALLTMHWTHCSVNIYTQIGLVTLIGLISKHGILIVEFANQLQAKGENCFEAVKKAATIRLRPVLMTTSAMIISALPLAFATGAGSAARQQLGWVIVGGMAFGTLLTLFIVPTAYTLIGRNGRFRKKST